MFRYIFSLLAVVSLALSGALLIACSAKESDQAQAGGPISEPLAATQPMPSLADIATKRGLEKAQLASDAFEMAAMANDVKTAREAYGLVSEALDEDPNNPQILLIRYNMRKDMGLYDIALQDLRAFNKDEPVAEFKLFECFLQERLLPEQIPNDCYQTALKLYQAPGRDDQTSKSTVLLIKRFLNEPGIDKELNVFLAGSPQMTQEEKEQFRHLFSNFDRSKIIHFYFPEPVTNAQSEKAAHAHQEEVKVEAIKKEATKTKATK